MDAINGSNTPDENGMVSKLGQIGNPNEKTLGAASRDYSANKVEEKGVENAHLVVIDEDTSDEMDYDLSEQDDLDSDANKKASEKRISLSVEVFDPPNGIEKGNNKQVCGKNLESGRSFDYDKVENPNSNVSIKEDDMAPLGDTDKFLVGDLVWVLTKKIKTWWPGQILDPSLLSNIAPNPKKNAPILVDYLGNNPMVWCSPKSLRPFTENFEYRSSLKNSRVFISAVKKAVYLYGNHIKAQINCPVENENRANETGSQAKVFLEINYAQNGSKKRRRNEFSSPQAMNGESFGTALVLTFAEGFPIPSKDALIATFCVFGALNGSETKRLKDNKSVQIVFRKISDAAEALKGIEKSRPYGPVINECRLQHLLPPKPIVEPLKMALVLTFAEGFPVPSKDALIATLCGFGPVNDSETKALSNNTARVVFRRGDDAVEAWKGVEKRSPFGPALISHRLQQLLPAPKPIGLKTSELKVADKPKDETDLAYIRKNLEMMMWKLEKEGHTLPAEKRETLENEIKGLLKKVNAMVGSTSSS